MIGAKKRLHIERVSPEQLSSVIDCRTPLGLFLAKEGRTWVAVDNSTRDAWTEGFPRKRQAVRWLRGEFEVGEAAKDWNWVDTAEKLIAAAACQGLEISTTEADLMLGYLEGHEYSLMVDAAGNTVRHDDQYGCRHRGDEPYPVQSVIEFCQEMNEELIRGDVSWEKSDESYLSLLRQDEQALAALMVRIGKNSYQTKQNI